MKHKVLMLASVASMIDQFNMQNLEILQEIRYEVHVACNFRQGNTCDAKQIDRLKKKLDEMGILWHQWDCPRDISSIKSCWAAYWQLQLLMERNPFAWIHCHSPVGGALARIAAHRMHVPVIYTAHGFHFYRGAPVWNWLLYYPAEKLLAYWTDVLITVNREDFCLARKKLHAGKIYHIPGIGIDTEHFRESSQEMQKRIHQEFCRKYRIPEDARILLSVGELSRRKNHRLVLEALAGLEEKNVYYLLCGRGKLKKRLMRDADRLGIAEYVRMPGYQEHVEELYQNTDVFVFPSRQEGLPVALMEAMAAGLPCIVSDIRGNRELIDRRGLRFSPKKAGELRCILKILLDNADICAVCGRENRAKIKAYDRSAVKPVMRRIYQR